MASISSRLAALKKPGNLAAGAVGLGGLALLIGALTKSRDTSDVERYVNRAELESRSQKVARILEAQRAQRSLAENQSRIAQANPTLYTSVMAGRRVPTGAVVLGGRPRMDLMRELAASMDSGAYQKRDPLSDLMG